MAKRLKRDIAIGIMFRHTVEERYTTYEVFVVLMFIMLARSDWGWWAWLVGIVGLLLSPVIKHMVEKNL